MAAVGTRTLLLGTAGSRLAAARLLPGRSVGTWARLCRCQPEGSRLGASSVPGTSWVPVRSRPSSAWAPEGSGSGPSSVPAASCLPEGSGSGPGSVPGAGLVPVGSRRSCAWAPEGSGSGRGSVPAASRPPGGLRWVHGSAAAAAGHNRWSKVRTVKGPRDAARSRSFQRLALRLRCAAREGGPDPALNPQLARLVQQCRAHNMPKGTIEAAIRGGEKASAGTSRLLVEARGPGGCQLLLELLSANPGHSLQQLRQLLARHGGSLAEGARHSFEEQGVVRVAPRDREGRLVSLELALEVALEVGAQDVVPEEEEEEEEAEPVLKFLCVPSALHQLRARLEASGLCPLSASIEFQPRAHLQLPPELCQQLQELLDALSLCPDLVRLYHNSQ